MPRKTDHEARRSQIADALMRLAAAQGLEAVSLRHVAAEAGVSTGMVQHYFRSKDEMMAFALGVVMDRVEARIAARAGGSEQSPRAVVRLLLGELLPLDETRRLEGHVGLAFLAYAASKPDLSAGLREDTAQLREFIADQVRAAQVNGGRASGGQERGGPGGGVGGRAPRIEPRFAATGLLALTEGLGMHLLNRHYAPDEALAVLDTHLDLILGPDRPGASPCDPGTAGRGESTDA